MKLDLQVDDARRLERFLSPKERRPPGATISNDHCARADRLLRDQLREELTFAARTGGRASGTVEAVLRGTLVAPVAPLEYVRAVENDLDTPARLTALETGGVPGLREALAERARRARIDVAAALRNDLLATAGPRDLVVATRWHHRLAQRARLSGCKGRLLRMTVTEQLARLATWYRERARAIITDQARDRVEELDGDLQRLENMGKKGVGELPICFLGNSGVGKSTLLNAMVGGVTPILPAGGVGPLTAQATLVQYSSERYFKATYLSAKVLSNTLFVLERDWGAASFCRARRVGSRQPA